jgi:hypothetical protein
MATMLCGMQFRMPRQSRQLTAIAGEIENNARAEHGTVKASIHYFRQGKTDGLKTLKQFQSAWKAAVEHYARYPFSGGMKLLPASLVEAAVITNSGFAAREAEIRRAWVLDEYPDWQASAPTRMGSLYDAGDFPSATDCMNRFKCEVVIVPLSEADQWQRIAAISTDLAATMASQHNETVERVTQAAHAKLWADVMAPISHIVDTLSKDKSKLYSSLLENVMSITALVPAYNEIHGDAQLTALANKATEELSKISIEDLRTSAEARETTLAKAKALVTEYQPYARAFELDDEE